MSPVRHPPKAALRWRPPHRVIIARGEHIRTFTVRPWLIAVLAIFAVAITAGYVGATGYLVFRDDLLATSIARQASMQRAYEDRIAGLRADIDRLTSRQLLNQQEVEAEVQKLVSRQTNISERLEAISGLSAAARAQGLAVTDAPAPEPAAPKPSLRTSAIPAIVEPANAATPAAVSKQPFARISDLSTDLDRLANRQIVYVNGLGASIADRNSQIANILKDIVRDVPSSPPLASDVGGAYIPLTGRPDPAAFSAGIARVKGELDRYTAIRQLTTRLPLTAPVADPSISSDFGQRTDPFLGTPALHTGLDFRAEKGLPVGATAPGVVIAATSGYNGGYGNMVDVDHGNGIVTRFGHLSEIAVKVGDVVAKGTIIGRAGATGRATGPHVHYEVRIDDDPTDPSRFLAAGEKLLPLL